MVKGENMTGDGPGIGVELDAMGTRRQTMVRVTVTVGDRTFEGIGGSFADHHDEPVKEIGVELALSRALKEVARAMSRDAWSRVAPAPAPARSVGTAVIELDVDTSKFEAAMARVNDAVRGVEFWDGGVVRPVGSGSRRRGLLGRLFRG